MTSTMKYLLLSFLLLASGVVSSCVFDEYPIENDVDEVQFDGDVLKFTFTLDNMGGEAATRAENPLAKWENYVDAEKVRVLVFDNDDQFLFESKNRYIKQLNPSPDHSTWSVTIPMGSYGNDKEYDWDWDEIRKRMSANSFKIALLVNRPDREWNMGILQRNKLDPNGTTDCDPTNPDTYDGPDPYVVPQGWFGSTGPHWNRTNSAASATDEKDVKDVFHLHHCQYDPIYHGKNYYTTGNSFKNTNQNFYGSVTEGDAEQPYMGATSSWVDWGIDDKNNKDDQGWEYRKTVLPSEKHPIPMYGIQEYAPLTGWKKGTSVNLDRLSDKPVSLLRSVVKLELIVPKGTAQHVLLFYPNIYARCEPMDVWTSTDLLWTANDRHKADCEWNLIKNFRMTEVTDETGNTSDLAKDVIPASRLKIQQRMSFLYGIWRKEKNWSFNDDNDGRDIDSYYESNYKNKELVRIFNPCTQRNTAVYVAKCPGYESDLVYDHFVAYVGERNVNDPSNLGDLGNHGGGHCTVMYWCIMSPNLQEHTVKDDPKKYYYKALYSLPIIQYDQKDLDLTKVLRKGYCFPDDKGVYAKPSNGTNALTNTRNSGASTNMGSYAQKVHSSGHPGKTDYDSNFDEKYWPLPLLRNHVYSITMTGMRSGGNVADDEVPFAVRFEEKHTENINFQ